jgi:predicted amidohydrolase YtcJ
MTVSAQTLRDRPTLVLVNAKIWTGDAARPWAEALAAAGDRLVAVGSNADVERLVTAPGAVPSSGQLRRLDAGGALVVPGFIDSHVHFLVGGMRLTEVQLRDARSRAEFVKRIRAYAAAVPTGTWITGGCWDHQNWGGELPTRDWIDRVTPDHPVWVTRLDGHMSLANSIALRLAGVDANSKAVEGGTIDRDAAGRPTGLLRDNAMALVGRVLPNPSDAQLDRALRAAMQYVAQYGVTSIHHMGSFADLDVFERARSAGALTTRIYAAVPIHQWKRLADTIASRRFGPDGRGDEWLRIGMLKGFVDGSLGSHTAAFTEPFTDAPHDRGLLVNTEADLERWAAAADRAGLQVAAHAIGDRANRLMLEIYERVAQANGWRDRRFRIEHAQHLAARDIPRFGALGVVPSMQPYHAIDDGRWADKVIGPERARGTYAFRSLLATGARPAFGSDWFVAPPTPLEGIYAAVTRRTLDDQHPDGWVPEQKITVEQALRAYTAGGAYAGFEERDKGVLAAPRLADFVVLEGNIFEIPGPEIRNVRVRMTVVGGRIVYSR